MACHSTCHRGRELRPDSSGLSGYVAPIQDIHIPPTPVVLKDPPDPGTRHSRAWGRVPGSGFQESTRATHGNQCRRTIERKVPKGSEKPQPAQAEWELLMISSIRALLWKPQVGTENQGHSESHIFFSSGLRGESRLEARPSVGSTNLSRVPGTHRSAPNIP